MWLGSHGTDKPNTSELESNCAIVLGRFKAIMTMNKDKLFYSIHFGAIFMLNMSVQDILTHNQSSHMLEAFVYNLFIKCNPVNESLNSTEKTIKTFSKVNMPFHELAYNTPLDIQVKDKRLLIDIISLKF